MAESDYGLSINGQWRRVASEPHHSLLEVLREEFRLTGTKVGCNEGECGSCTVLLDGKPVLACLLLIGDAVGRDVITIEGLSSGDALTGGGQPHPLQAPHGRRRRYPVRLLHSGDHHERLRFAAGAARPHVGRNPPSDSRQHLSLHRLRQNHRSGAKRRR